MNQITRQRTAWIERVLSVCSREERSVKCVAISEDLQGAVTFDRLVHATCDVRCHDRHASPVVFCTIPFAWLQIYARCGEGRSISSEVHRKRGRPPSQRCSRCTRVPRLPAAEYIDEATDRWYSGVAIASKGSYTVLALRRPVMLSIPFCT